MNYKIVIFVLLSLIVSTKSKAQVHIYTLEETLELAHKNNLTLQKQNITIESSKELKKSLYQKYFPMVSLNAIYSELGDGFSFSEMTNDFIDAIYFDEMHKDDYSPIFLKRGAYGSLGITQPVYTGGIITTANKLADLATKASVDMEKMKENEVDLEIEKYFWTLVQCYEAHQALCVMDSLVKFANRDASTALEAGLVTKNDAMEVEIYKSKLKGMKLKVQSGIDLCKTYLAHLTNQDSYDSIQWEGLSNLKEPAEYIVDHKSALQLRPESDLLDLQIKSYELRKKLTKGYMLPKLFFTGGVSGHKFWALRDDNLWSNKIETRHFTWTLGAILSVPISAWWTSKHDLKRDSYHIKQAELDKKEKSSLMSLQMELKWKELTRAYQQTIIAHDQLEQSEQNAKQQASAYRNGVITMTNRLQADALYQESFINYIDACTKYRLATTEYLHATAR